MICERCGNDSPEVTDQGACMVAHCWECLGECRPCQSDLADDWEADR